MRGWILRATLAFVLAILCLAQRPLSPFGPAFEGAALNLVFAFAVAFVAILLEGLVRRGSARSIGAGAMGAIVGGLAFAMVLRALPFHPTVRPFGYAIAIWVGAACGAAWIRPRAVAAKREAGGLLLDTSAIIDGRIVEVARSGIASGPWLVPTFVIRELQQVADSEDPGRRARGRRGLDALEKLRALPGIVLRVAEPDGNESAPVDERLVGAAGRTGASLVTTDFNLVKVAGLHGIRVVNVNELAQGMRGAVSPGESLSLSIVRAGKEPGQGVGFLDDGTMVVVTEAADRVGAEVEVVVTGATQTASGRMLFGRVKGSGLTG